MTIARCGACDNGVTRVAGLAAVVDHDTGFEGIELGVTPTKEPTIAAAIEPFLHRALAEFGAVGEK